jgi:hypothetical protein
MDNSESLPIIIVGILTWSLIIYFIILTAVKSAGNSQARDVKTLMRMKAKEMRKQGFTYQEISDCITDSEEDFWNKLQ